MSIYHKVKCSQEEALQFKDKVKAFLAAENLPYTSLKALRSYNGEIRIYNGRTTERKRLRYGRKWVARKNPDGTFDGTEEGIIRLQKIGGDVLFQKTYEPIESLDYTQVFRVDDWEEEKKAIKDFLNGGLR